MLICLSGMKTVPPSQGGCEEGPGMHKNHIKFTGILTMMKPSFIGGVTLSGRSRLCKECMDTSRLPQRNRFGIKLRSVWTASTSRLTQLLFLTPWVHISMVTSMFVYLFPDFFLFLFFCYNWSPTRAASLGTVLFVANMECTCPYV